MYSMRGKRVIHFWTIQTCVKIPILVVVSNAVNPQVNPARPVLPGLCAKSHSARLVPQPSRPVLDRISSLNQPEPRTKQKYGPGSMNKWNYTFISHFDWLGVSPPRPAQENCSFITFACRDAPKLPRYGELFSLPLYFDPALRIKLRSSSGADFSFR